MSLPKRPSLDWGKTSLGSSSTVGGDLAYNALQRLPDVMASCPNKVLVLIGGNDDVMALVSSKAQTFFRVSKRLPRDPSPEWFSENLQVIVRRRRTETSATIGLCSLPPIGEDPASANRFQSELNGRVLVIRDGPLQGTYASSVSGIFRHSGMTVALKTTFEVFTRVGPDNSLERFTECSVRLVTDQPSDVYQLSVTLFE
jgi:hypothetical protein